MVDIDGNSTQPKQDSNRNSPKNENENEDMVDKNKEETLDEDSVQQQSDNEEKMSDGHRSPTASTYSQLSDDEPAESPSLTQPYPASTLLIYPLQRIYTCLKCKDILREPVQIKACGHRLCYQCHEDIRSGPAPRCPDDQMELDDKKPRVDKNFKKEIEGLDVKCKQREQGCKWEGSIEDYSAHVEFCNYNDMVCVCGAVFPKRFKQKHRDRECGKELVPCDHCKDEIPREMKKIHLDECPKRPLLCPNKCDKDLQIPRDEVDTHLDTECPRTKIMCEFEDIGCFYKATREKMMKHYTKEITNHVKLLHDQEFKHDQLLNKIAEKLSEHEFMISREDDHIGDLEKLARSQVIWKIEDYSGKMKQAKAGNSETVFYPPFTTSKHGYRVSVSVCLNGDGKGKGTHMAVFLCIHKGDYDVFLKWPFDHRVTFTLLDQNEHVNERQHIKLSIKPNPSPDNDKFLARPKTDKNASFGLTMFAKHDEIESRNYIQDNTILLKVSVDCLGTDAVLLA